MSPECRAGTRGRTRNPGLAATQLRASHRHIGAHEPWPVAPKPSQALTCQTVSPRTPCPDLLPTLDHSD